MANAHAAAATTTTTTGARRKVEVDPSILGVIESPSAPVRTPKPPRIPKSVPGRDGTIECCKESARGQRAGDIALQITP